MYTYSLVDVFCSRHLSVKQLTFEIASLCVNILIIVFIRVLKIKLNLVKFTFRTAIFLSSIYGSVRYGIYNTLNMARFSQLIG